MGIVLRFCAAGIVEIRIKSCKSALEEVKRAMLMRQGCSELHETRKQVSKVGSMSGR